MANCNANTPPVVADSIEGLHECTGECTSFDEAWKSMLAAVPSMSLESMRPYENTEQVVLALPRITLGSPWTPTPYTLPERGRGSPRELQHSSGSRGSTPVPFTPPIENVSRQDDAHISKRQETTTWQPQSQSRAASPDPEHSENPHGTARHVPRWQAETDPGEERDSSRTNQMAFERRSSQTLTNARARHDGQGTASSSRHRGSRVVSRRVDKRSRMAEYSRFLLSRIQQVATEVDHNEPRYQDSSEGEEEIAALNYIDKQLNEVLHNRVMRRGESVLSSSHWSDTGSRGDA